MTDDTKQKIGDKSAQPGDGAHKLDNPETKELVNAGGTAMRGIESTRTNKSSGSFDESQEMSIEIDFGNGHRESRRNKGPGETGQPAETTKPSREQLKQETLGALVPLAQVADVKAFPVMQSQADHADVSKFPQPQPLPFRPELKPLPIPILPKDGPSPILHPPHPETAAKASLEPPLPRPNGPVYVDRTVPSPLLHQSHAHEAASVESAALQAVVPRGADSGVVAGARDLPLSPKDQPISGYSPETHDKNGFVKDPVGYGLMLAQQIKPGAPQTDTSAAPHTNPLPFTPTFYRQPDSKVPIATPGHLPGEVQPLQQKLLPKTDVQTPTGDNRGTDKPLNEQEKAAFAALGESKTALEASVLKVITDAGERQQFFDDMRDFEKDYVKRSPLDRASAFKEIGETFKQVDRLLTATSDAIPPEAGRLQKLHGTEWRVQAAEQIMHHAAVPTSVTQGPLAVCATEALQVRHYYKEPSSIAKLVADVILTGKYHAKTADKSFNGLEYPHNLVPDRYARVYDVNAIVEDRAVKTGKDYYKDARSFASQVYDVAAINMALGDRPQPLHYRLATDAEVSLSENKRKKAQGGVYVSDPTKILDWKMALVEGKTPSDEDLCKLNRWITGKYERGFVVTAGDLNSFERVNPHIRELTDFAFMENASARLYKPDQLGQMFLKLKSESQWPPIVRIDLGKPPISMPEANSHFMVVTDVSPDGKLLSYDMTWAKTFDKTGTPSVSTYLFGESMLSPDINKFDYVAKHREYFDRYSIATNWNARKNELHNLCDEISNKGLAQALRRYPGLEKDPEVAQWKAANPWDRNLTEWSNVVKSLLKKYATRK